MEQLIGVLEFCIPSYKRDITLASMKGFDFTGRNTSGLFKGSSLQTGENQPFEV